jgi:hypothetical protein
VGSAISAATSELVTKARTAVASYTFLGHPVAVVDGPPETQTSPTLCIGLPEPPDLSENPGSGTQTSREWYGLAAAETIEDFTIPCYIDVIKPGTAEAVAATRAAATEILDLFWAEIRSDPSLGGLVSGLARIPSAEVVPFGVARGGQQGRRTVVRFGVRCINEYVT